MVNKILKILIIAVSITSLGSSFACPVCHDEKHRPMRPFFVDNNNQTANNARVEKIQKILESMKAAQN